MSNGPNHFGDDASDLNYLIPLSGQRIAVSQETATRVERNLPTDLIEVQQPHALPDSPSSGDPRQANTTVTSSVALEKLRNLLKGNASPSQLDLARLELLRLDPAQLVSLDEMDSLLLREQISQIPKHALDSASPTMRQNYIAFAPLLGERVLSPTVTTADESRKLGDIGIPLQNVMSILASYAITDDTKVRLDLDEIKGVVTRLQDNHLLGPDIDSATLKDFLRDGMILVAAHEGHRFPVLQQLLRDEATTQALLLRLNSDQSLDEILSSLHSDAITGDRIAEATFRGLVTLILSFRSKNTTAFHAALRRALQKLLTQQSASDTMGADTLASGPPVPPFQASRATASSKPEDSAPIDYQLSRNDDATSPGSIPSATEIINRASDSMAKSRNEDRQRRASSATPAKQSSLQHPAGTAAIPDSFVSFYTPEVRQALVAFGYTDPSFYPAFVLELFGNIAAQLEAAQLKADQKKLRHAARQGNFVPPPRNPGLQFA